MVADGVGVGDLDGGGAWAASHVARSGSLGEVHVPGQLGLAVVDRGDGDRRRGLAGGDRHAARQGRVIGAADGRAGHAVVDGQRAACANASNRKRAVRRAAGFGRVGCLSDGYGGLGGGVGSRRIGESPSALSSGNPVIVCRALR